MKFSITKITIVILLLFGVIIAACVLWNPIKVSYYSRKILSDDSKEKVIAFENLIRSGKKGEAALIKVMPKGQREFEFLKEHWKDPNGNIEDVELKTIEKPLHHAAFHNYRMAAELLIAKGAETDSKDNSFGRSPLHVAVVKRYRSFTLMLIEHGADLSIQDNFGRSPPLHTCAIFGFFEIAAMLIRKGALVNQSDSEGYTPLHFASQASVDYSAITWAINEIDKKFPIGKNMEIENVDQKERALNSKKKLVKLLIKSGANLNARTSFKMTPLHSACSNGLKDVVVLLIKNGAKTDSPDQWGKTPLDYAKYEGFTDIIDVLEEFHDKSKDVESKEPSQKVDSGLSGAVDTRCIPKTRNEDSGLKSIGLVVYFQQNHFDKYGAYATSVQELVNKGLAGYGLTKPELSGYVFEIRNATDKDWQVICIPVDKKNRYFFTNQTGVVRVSNTEEIGPKSPHIVIDEKGTPLIIRIRR
jgi:ankyrin repeat protein